MPFPEDNNNNNNNNQAPGRSTTTRRNSLDSLGGGWFGYDGFHYDHVDATNNNYGNFNNYGNYSYNESRRNSLLGGRMMPRNSLGFGYNGYNNYYGNPQGQYGNGNSQDRTPANPSAVSQSNREDNQLDDIDLDEEDSEQTIEYLTARAHAAQLLAEEESKRLQDSLRRLEEKKRLSAGGKKKGKDTKMGAAAGGGGGRGGGAKQTNSNDTQQPMPNFQANNVGAYNNIMMTMTNYNNGNFNNGNVAKMQNANNNNIHDNNMQNPNNQTNNTPSTDEQLFERSRLNNYQMNMRNATPHPRMDNTNFSGMNHMYDYGYHGMMPSMMMDYNSMNGMSNHPMFHSTNTVNNSMNINSNNNDPPSQQKKKRKRRSTNTSEESESTSPKKKEVKTIRRPLSAYNIFFSEMRETILREEEEKIEKSGGEKDGVETNVNGDKQEDEKETDKINDIQVKETDQSQKDQPNNDSTTNTSKNSDLQSFTQSLMKKRLTSDPTKRIHRKTHGKVSFTTLVRLVGRRWKELPEEDKARYKELAEVDRKRYRKEKEEMARVKREEARKVRKMARQVQMGSRDGEKVEEKLERE